LKIEILIAETGNSLPGRVVPAHVKRVGDAFAA
jgi:hypothetical protein